MIHFLRGNLIQLRPWGLVLEVGHVGYYIKITLQVYEELKGVLNEEVSLHTRVIYKEMDQTIYGFLQEEDAQLFDFLRSLTGVGPQLASNIISTLGVSELITAIENKDDAGLMRVPKVGKSIASKILFESESKKKKLAALKNLISSSSSAEVGTISYFHEQLEEALLRLGFQKKEIDRASESMKKNQTAPPQTPPKEIHYIQEWIRLYLKYL